MAVLEALACRLPSLITTACHFPELGAAGGAVVVTPTSDAVTQGLRDLLDRIARRAGPARPKRPPARRGPLHLGPAGGATGRGLRVADAEEERPRRRRRLRYRRNPGTARILTERERPCDLTFGTPRRQPRSRRPSVPGKSTCQCDRAGQERGRQPEALPARPVVGRRGLRRRQPEQRSDRGGRRRLRRDGRSVPLQRPYPKKKNWALENLPFRNEWVLIVDADEVVVPELAAEIARRIAGDEADGYYLNSRYYFLGRRIRHCGYSSCWNLRLFKHRLGRYEKMPDQHRRPHRRQRGPRTRRARRTRPPTRQRARAPRLSDHRRLGRETQPIRDLGGRALANDSSTSRSRQRSAASSDSSAGSRRSPGGCRCGRSFRFVYAYFLRLGFLDGKPGLIFCGLLAFYDFLASANRYEQQIAGSPEPGGSMSPARPTDELSRSAGGLVSAERPSFARGG